MAAGDVFDQGAHCGLGRRGRQVAAQGLGGQALGDLAVAFAFLIPAFNISAIVALTLLSDGPRPAGATARIGAEIGPKDIGLGGITGNSGLRLRMEVSTFDDANSFRPMAGVVAHF